MIGLRWVAGGVLFAFGAWVTIVNDYAVLVSLFKRRHTGSLTPLLGGGLVTLALVVLPVAGLAKWWWVPLLLDYGSAPLLTHTALFFAYRAIRPRS